MKTTTLIFPNTNSLAAFIVSIKVPKARVNGIHHSITCILTSQQIERAHTEFGATCLVEEEQVTTESGIVDVLT
jgi:hypothetical protein